MNELVSGGISQAIGSVFDLGTSAVNRGANYRRSKKLMKEQMKNEKEMSEHYYDMSMRKWEDTGYGAQMDQMKRAGLNPGLMYGGAGAGGQTSQVQASPQSAGAVGGQGSSMNNMLMMSQMELMKAQANKTEAEAEKIKGVDTEKTVAETASLTQGVENQKAVQELTKAQHRMAEIDGEVKWQTMEQVIKGVELATERALHDVKTAKWEANLNEATYQDKVDIVKNEAIGVILKNHLLQSQKGLTDEQARKTAQDIINSIKQVEQGQEMNNIKSFEAGVKALRPDWDEILTEPIFRLLDKHEYKYKSPKTE